MRAFFSVLAILACCNSIHAAGNVDPKEADASFRAALSKAHAGNHEAAITEFRKLLTAVPAPRIKLELARSLFYAGQYEEALSLFKEVYLEPQTPQTVKRNILPFIEGAELRSLRLRYGVRAITDSNPSKVADGGTIFFNGVPLEYQPPQAKKTAYGIEPWLSVEKLWSSGFLTKFYGSARLFEDDELNAGRFQFAVAREVAQVPGLYLQAAVDTEIRRNHNYVLPSLEGWKRFRLSDQASFGIGSQIGYMKVRNDEASGGFYRPYVFGDWTVLPNLTLFAGASLEHLNSKNGYYSYVDVKADLGMRFNVAGLDLTPQLTVSQMRFTEFDPFWGLHRKDLTVRPQLSLSHDSLEWNGFKPELRIFYERRTSNVDIFEYDQVGGAISLRQLF